MGSNGSLAGISQLVALLNIFAVPFFVLWFVAEAFLRLHDAR